MFLKGSCKPHPALVREECGPSGTRGSVGAEAGADAQGVKDPSNGLQQVLDVQEGHNCIGRVLLL